MKKINTVLAVAVVGTGIISLQACKKYEDGPLISMQAKIARLTGEWKHTGGDTWDSDTEIIVEFEKDGDLKFTLTYSYPGYFYSNIYKGSWEWGDKKESIRFNATSGIGLYAYTIDEEWEITRLTNKELNGTDENNYDWEFEKI